MGEIRVIYSTDFKSLIREANKLGITKDNYIDTIKDNNLFIMIYYYEDGR